MASPERAAEPTPDDEEEDDSRFCQYMRGGGCKDALAAWEECVDAAMEEAALEGRTDLGERCSEATYSLVRCMKMEAHVAVCLRCEAAAAARKDKVAPDEEDFSLYMKCGGCRDAFVAWDKCIDAAYEEGIISITDMTERCYEASSNLKKCMEMEAHADCYAPIMRDIAASAKEDKEAGRREGSFLWW
ncbi:hypothetical protein ACP70R_015288 [Stipagrostis hirtigluma subsp. patula]